MSLKKKGGKTSEKPRREEFLPESDENFAYIAGYTPGGMPYGISWEQEEILEAQRVLFDTDGDYVPLPSHYDIHDYYMHDFCFSLPKGRIAEDLIRSISGRGAFRRFKGVAQRHGIEQNWYRFRDEAYKATAQQWCEENGLAWREGPGPT